MIIYAMQSMTLPMALSMLLITGIVALLWWWTLKSK